MKPHDTQHRANTAQRNAAHHWALIRALLAPLMSMVAFHAVVDWSVYRSADRWLRDVEAFARRVLFALAVALKFKPVRRTSAPPGPPWRAHEHHPRKAESLFRLQLFGASPAPYALVETDFRRPETYKAYNAPLTYDAAPLHNRLASPRSAPSAPIRCVTRVA